MVNEVIKQTSIGCDDSKILKKNLWVILVGYLIIYGIRELIGIDIPDSFFSLYCLFAFVILDIEQSFCFYMSTIITTTPFLEVRLVYIFISILKMISKQRVVVFEKKPFILVMSMLILQFIDLAIFDNNSLGTMIYNYVNVVTVFIVPLIWSTLHLSKSHVEAAAKCFICGCIICSVSLIWQSISLYGLSYVIGGTNRLGMDLDLGRSTMTTSLNTNTLAELMVCVIIICFVLHHNKRMKIITVCLLFVFGIVTILLTQSRGGLLCLAVFLIYYISFCINGQLAPLKKAIIVALIVMVLMFVLAKFPNLQDGILNRLNNQTDLSNGRLEINAECLHAWNANIYTLFFGYGARNYMSAAIGLRNSAHNMFVDILVSWGITGVFLILGWVMFLIRKHISSVKNVDKRVAFIPAVMYFISLQDGQFLNVEIPFIMISFFIIFGGSLNNRQES